ncbi:Spore wall protein 26 [Nosema granulosis]|uniref:Spore wall protein 26 n=1 Tax=Nosema granulosis TaxID=83296 RepID=A0A9P6KXX6_9MICR|nr:Spore wall protein 26 [Nosema granulosis]
MRLILSIVSLTLVLTTRTADKIFDPEARLTSSGPFPVEENIYSGISANPISGLVGTTYLSVKNLLSHYFSYYFENVPDFKRWYESVYYEMEQDKKSKILNELNLNLKTIDDLKDFWLETEGSYLEGNLLNLKNLLITLERGINSMNPIYNDENNNEIKTNLSNEPINKRFLNEVKLIYGFLESGLDNYLSRKFTDVHEMFLDASIEKKKLELLFNDLSIVP